MLTEVIPQVFGFQSFGTAPNLNVSGCWLQGSEVFGGSSTRVQQLIGVAIRIWRLGHSGHSDTSCSLQICPHAVPFDVEPWRAGRRSAPDGRSFCCFGSGGACQDVAKIFDWHALTIATDVPDILLKGVRWLPPRYAFPTPLTLEVQ